MTYAALSALAAPEDVELMWRVLAQDLKQICARRLDLISRGERLEPVIGVICVQAVRLLQLRDLARTAGETSAKSVVPPQWLETLQRIRRRPRPIHTIREFLHALAGLGGFLGRKGDGEPGWITLWHGLETLLIALRGYRSQREKCG